MGYFLLDNPPRSPQFYPSRNANPTWAVAIHTSEGPANAAMLAGFLARRSDPGSYHTIVDADTTIDMVPHTFTAFSIATPNFNSRTYSVCIAGRAADLRADDWYTRACVDRVGAVIANLWATVGVDARMHARWVGGLALSQPGLFCHGDVQADRSDAWSRNPDRAVLDQLLVDAVLRHTNSQEDEDMKSVLVLDPSSGKVWDCWGLFRRWASPTVFNTKRFLGVQYLDGSVDAGFRQFMIDATSEVR